MKLTKAQAVIAKDPHRFRVLVCGRRFGKTFLAIDQMKGRASIPNSRIAYIAPTFQQARDIAWGQLKKDCNQAAEAINESRLEIRLVNGSLILLRGWEAIETLRGQQFDLIVLDEVANFKNFEISWQEVLRPTLTDTVGEAIFISTPKGFNHFYKLYNTENDKEKGKDYKSFHFTTYDNPHIPLEEIEKAKQELPEDQFAQEYLADFRKTSGLVYKEFDRDIHTFDEPGFEGSGHKIQKILAGVDFGYTNPAAVVTIEKDTDGNYWVTDEFYETKRTDAMIADYVAAQRFNEVYADPENPGGIDELRRRHLNVRDVKKGKGSIEKGISIVRELFKAKRLFISTRCENLIWELEVYSYPNEVKDKNLPETPVKDHDHLLDALRYVLMMQGEGGTGVKILAPKYTAYNVV